MYTKNLDRVQVPTQVFAESYAWKIEDLDIIKAVETRSVVLTFKRRQLSAGSRKAFAYSGSGPIVHYRHPTIYQDKWIYSHMKELVGREAHLVTCGDFGYISETAESAVRHILDIFDARQ